MLVLLMKGQGIEGQAAGQHPKARRQGCVELLAIAVLLLVLRMPRQHKQPAAGPWLLLLQLVLGSSSRRRVCFCVLTLRLTFNRSTLWMESIGLLSMCDNAGIYVKFQVKNDCCRMWRASAGCIASARLAGLLSAAAKCFTHHASCMEHG